jgi:hypothetical protein
MLRAYIIKLPLFIVHPAGDFRPETKVPMVTLLVKSCTLPPEGPAAGRQTASRCSGVRSSRTRGTGNPRRTFKSNPPGRVLDDALISNRRFFYTMVEWQAGVQS